MDWTTVQERRRRMGQWQRSTRWWSHDHGTMGCRCHDGRGHPRSTRAQKALKRSLSQSKQENAAVRNTARKFKHATQSYDTPHYRCRRTGKMSLPGKLVLRKSFSFSFTSSLNFLISSSSPTVVLLSAVSAEKDAVAWPSGRRWGSLPPVIVPAKTLDTVVGAVGMRYGWVP